MRTLSALLFLFMLRPALQAQPECDQLLPCFQPSQLGPASFFFNNCSSAPPPGFMQFLWDYGDGNLGSGVAPTYTYSSPGTYIVCLTAFWGNCSDSTCTTITVEDVQLPCDSTFFVAFGSSTNGNVVTFQATSGGQADGYLWNFGDGTSGGGQFATHVYSDTGPYTVCLEGWYWNGSDTCWTGPECQVVGPFDTSNPCDDLDASFMFNSTGALVVLQADVFDNSWGYLWELGDGAQADGYIVTHQYPGPTLFQACLTVWTWDPFLQDTCFATSCQLIDLTGAGNFCDQLQVGFAWNDSPSGVWFSNATIGTGTQTSFQWDFGDGNTSTNPQPFHTYPEPGSYTVCLTATSVYAQPNGPAITCIDSTCTTITTISGPQPCDSTFFIAFGSSTNGNVVTFQSTSGGQADGYVWSFGDGIMGSGQTTIHAYSGVGPFTVCLEAWYWNGADTCWTGPECQEVGPFDICDILNPCFTTTDLGDGSFTFQNCSAALLGAQYTWNLGDGSTSTGLTAQHTYADPGTYIACLTIDWQSCVDSVCNAVEWNDGPTDCDSTFFVAFGFSTNGNVVVFQATSGGQADGYVWNFGDGTSGGGAFVTHVYNGAGPYTVCLDAWYWNGVDTCWTGPVCQAVGPFSTGNPCDELDAGFTSIVAGLGVNFQSDVVNPAWSYTWDFGDGTTGTGPSAGHIYPGPTIYQVCLSVGTWDPILQDSCFVTNCQIVDLTGVEPCDLLIACFQPSQLSSTAFFFNNCSTGPQQGAIQYLWDFGNGEQSTEFAPLYTYSAPGIYTACLTAFWQDCTDSTCVTIAVVNSDPCTDLDAGFTAFLGGLSVNFQNNAVSPSWTYAWDFGDGTTGTGPSPFHTYPGPTLYQACVTVGTWDPVAQDSCFVTNCMLVDLTGTGNTCDTTFAVDFTWQATGPTVVFIGTTSTPADGYLWDLGEGNTAWTQVHTHIYEPPGPYEVCFSAWYWTGADSCWATACQSVDPFNTSISTTGTPVDLLVYPSPAREWLFIELWGTRGKPWIQLVAADGRLVREARSEGELHRMGLGGIAPGMHVLRIGTEEGILYHKVMIE